VLGVMLQTNGWPIPKPWLKRWDCKLNKIVKMKDGPVIFRAISFCMLLL
jgi:hypothetical protein